MGFSTKGIVAILIPQHNYFAIDIIANMFFGNVELLWQDENERKLNIVQTHRALQVKCVQNVNQFYADFVLLA